MRKFCALDTCDVPVFHFKLRRMLFRARMQKLVLSIPWLGITYRVRVVLRAAELVHVHNGVRLFPIGSLRCRCGVCFHRNAWSFIKRRSKCQANARHACAVEGVACCSVNVTRIRENVVTYIEAIGWRWSFVLLCCFSEQQSNPKLSYFCLLVIGLSPIFSFLQGLSA